jgi:hypothetical protein
VKNVRTVVAPGAPVLTLPISEGDEGIDQTVQAMRAVIHDASEDSRAVKALATRLRTEAGIGRLPLAVYDYIRKTFVFAADPRDVDAMMRPDEMIAAIHRSGTHTVARDCDDVAVFACSLLRVFDIPTVLIVMSKERSGPFLHVFYGVVGANAETHGPPPITPFDPQERIAPGQWTHSFYPGARVKVYPVL